MRRRLVLLLLLAPAAVAGCSAEPGAMPRAEAVPAASRPVVARIVDFDYRPARLSVRVGQRIRWRNADTVNHTVSFRRGPGELGNVDPGRSLRARFSRPGTYSYVCRYHPSMVGRVEVASP